MWEAEYGQYGQYGQHGQYGQYGQCQQYGQYAQHGQPGQNRMDLDLQDSVAMPLLYAPDADYMENTSIRARFAKVILKDQHGLYGKYKHLGDSARCRRARKKKKTPK